MKKYLSFVLVAALFAACTPNNEVGTPFKAGQEVTLTAHMPNAGNNGAQQLPGKQRVYGIDTAPHDPINGEIKLYWEEGDQIKVTVGNKSAIFTITEADESRGTFKGVMPADGTSYSVQHPVEEPDLSEQTYLDRGFLGKGLMKMATETNGTIDGGFTLKAQSALLGLLLKLPDGVNMVVELGKIVLTNLADSKTYTLNCSGATLAEYSALFYIIVPAGEWASGFKVDVYLKDGVTILKTLTKSGSVTFAAGQAVKMDPQTLSVPEYKGIGEFSVSQYTKVSFAPGNLQYTRSTNTWSFASAQYEMIDTDNVIGGSVSLDPTSGYIKEGTALADKIDLFGWSTNSTNFGVNTSADNNDYQGSFVDWGTNKIGVDAPNTWRTLTYDEWFYLRYTRVNANYLMGVAQVNDVNGLIILPDNWTCPDGVTFKSGFIRNTYDRNVDYYADHQTFTADQWSRLESAGAVFLPAAGYRQGLTVGNVQGNCCYWSATTDPTSSPYSLLFQSFEAILNARSRYFGYPVRLVKYLQ